MTTKRSAPLPRGPGAGADAGRQAPPKKNAAISEKRSGAVPTKNRARRPAVQPEIHGERKKSGRVPWTCDGTSRGRLSAPAPRLPRRGKPHPRVLHRRQLGAAGDSLSCRPVLDAPSRLVVAFGCITARISAPDNASAPRLGA
jgi:hypothetical protein